MLQQSGQIPLGLFDTNPHQNRLQSGSDAAGQLCGIAGSIPRLFSLYLFWRDNTIKLYESHHCENLLVQEVVTNIPVPSSSFQHSFKLGHLSPLIQILGSPKLMMYLKSVLQLS